jgi:hypothetical protein
MFNTHAEASGAGLSWEGGRLRRWLQLDKLPSVIRIAQE